jgi:uncharacterized protein
VSETIAFVVAWVVPFLIGMVTAVFNVVGGGGSLLTIPALVETGLSAQAANATNRIGVWLQAVVSSTTFVKRKQVPFPIAWQLMPFGMAGAIAGAVAAAKIDEMQFRLVLAIVFAAMGVQLLRDLLRGKMNAPPSDLPTEFSVKLALATVGIGFYGGFIQAGAGIVILLVMTSVGSMGIKAANGLKVFLVLGFATVSLIVFLSIDRSLIAWGPGLTFGTGSMVGGWLGARYHEKIDGQTVGWILVVAVFAAAGRFAGLF